MFPNEQIMHCVNGQYEAGFALLCATDQRVLLIDKKPMYLTLEDIRYDMIAELNYHHRLMNCTLLIFTPNKSLRFTAYNHARLRSLFNYAQEKVMEIRQQYAQHQLQPSIATEPISTPNLAHRGQLFAQSSTVRTTVPTEQQQISLGGIRRVAPIVNAYTRLPMLSRQHRGFGA
jgi:hypothetical protein